MVFPLMVAVVEEVEVLSGGRVRSVSSPFCRGRRDSVVTQGCRVMLRLRVLMRCSVQDERDRQQRM